MRNILFLFILSLSWAAYGQGSAGKKKVLLGFDMIYPYKLVEGKRMAKVERAKKQGYIDEKGEEFVACKYDNIYPWEKGRAKVELAGKYGYINKEGEEFITVKYNYIGPFKNGLAVICNIWGKKGLINEQGEEVVPLD